MSGLSHPNVCALRGICISPFCLVTEFLPYGDLYKFIRTQKTFSWNLAIKIAIGTISHSLLSLTWPFFFLFRYC